MAEFRAKPALTFLVALGSCAAPSAEPPQLAPYACLLPSEQKMLVAELFFGRGIKGRGPLTDAEWAAFAAQTVTPNFPDGFTVFDGEGQWRNPLTGHIAHDPIKILLVAAKREPDLARRLSAVIDAYKSEFHVRRDKAALFQWVQGPPGDRSSRKQPGQAWR